MSELDTGQFETLRRAAEDLTRAWPARKTALALRAAGIAGGDRHGESLEAIASDAGVSRETVRRARNELLMALESQSAVELTILSRARRVRVNDGQAESQASARALRRLLTMTGPLAWDEVLSAWARAGGKHPYTPLPTDLASLRDWAHRAGGLVLTPAEDHGQPVTVALRVPEELDHVSVFLYRTLRGRTGGIDRADLLAAADHAELKATTIATALSHHPAVMRVGRGKWALRGRHNDAESPAEPVPGRRRVARTRPTSFHWGADGSLVIEFSVPRGPSPVLAVPRAVADVLEGHEYLIEGPGGPTRIAARNGRLWGFGPLLSGLGLSIGQRALLRIDVLAGGATLQSAEGDETPR